MAGTLVANARLTNLIDRHLIEIRPFDPKSAQLAHYPLDAERIYVIEDGKTREVHSFLSTPLPFVISPGAYVVVEI